MFARSLRATSRALRQASAVGVARASVLGACQVRLLSTSVPHLSTSKHEFKAETRQLLDIVASSLYSDKEVFIRELISNASDALEKLRYMQTSGAAVKETSKEMGIYITLDKEHKTFIIEDTGIGMTKEDLIDNLGTIARSGSKAFIAKMKASQGAGAEQAKDAIIGQFGVGFYAGFMVGKDIQVYSQSHNPETAAHVWKSEGTGEYEIEDSPAEAPARGTRIVINLKDDALSYADPDFVRGVIKKYSNFVSFPIFVNGEQVNTVRALWTLSPNEITEDDHVAFYRHIAGAFDKPKYSLQYRTDSPLNIRSLLYVPEMQMEKLGFGRMQPGVSLYCRKVLIKAKQDKLLPEWLRFLRGVVDSEDIPLNISREFLKDSSIVGKLNKVLTNRVVRFFQDEAKQRPEKYGEFYNEYAQFFREGIITDDENKEAIMSLMLFETSATEPGKRSSLAEYIARMGDRKEIFYVCAPSRALAEASPYMEAFKESKTEVLFCYDSFDDVMMSRFTEYQGKTVVGADSGKMPSPEQTDIGRIGKLSLEEEVGLRTWLKDTLGPERVTEIKGSSRLVSSPAVVISTVTPSMQRYMKSQNRDFTALPVAMEINPGHDIIKKLYTMRNGSPDIAKLVAEQMFDNALIAAGIMDEPRTMVARLNKLLEHALDARTQKTSASGKIILPH